MGEFLLPAIDRRGIRIVLGDAVLIEAGQQYQRTGKVSVIDGVRVTVLITHVKRVVIGPHSGKVFETLNADELEVLR